MVPETLLKNAISIAVPKMVQISNSQNVERQMVTTSVAHNVLQKIVLDLPVVPAMEMVRHQEAMDLLDLQEELQQQETMVVTMEQQREMRVVIMAEAREQTDRPEGHRVALQILLHLHHLHRKQVPLLPHRSHQMAQAPLVARREHPEELPADLLAVRVQAHRGLPVLVDLQAQAVRGVQVLLVVLPREDPAGIRLVVVVHLVLAVHQGVRVLPRQGPLVLQVHRAPLVVLVRDHPVPVDPQEAQGHPVPVVLPGVRALAHLALQEVLVTQDPVDQEVLDRRDPPVPAVPLGVQDLPVHLAHQEVQDPLENHLPVLRVVPAVKHHREVHRVPLVPDRAEHPLHDRPFHHPLVLRLPLHHALFFAATASSNLPNSVTTETRMQIHPEHAVQIADCRFVEIAYGMHTKNAMTATPSIPISAQQRVPSRLHPLVSVEMVSYSPIGENNVTWVPAMRIAPPCVAQHVSFPPVAMALSTSMNSVMTATVPPMMDVLRSVCSIVLFHRIKVP